MSQPDAGLRGMMAARRKRFLAEHDIDESLALPQDPGYRKRFCKYCGREIRFIYREKWLAREVDGGPHNCPRFR